MTDRQELIEQIECEVLQILRPACAAAGLSDKEFTWVRDALEWDKFDLAALSDQWISVDSRLPEIWVPVLCFLRRPTSYVVGFRSVIDWYERETERGIGDLIIAWQPLPEPPED